MQVGSVDPAWRGDGYQAMTEVNKRVHSRPVVEAVGVLVIRAINKPVGKFLLTFTVSEVFAV